MPKSPFDDWLAVQEHKRAHTIFLIEWLSLFALAWMFWSVMFFSAPGAIPPGLAATLVAGLYATCMIYGRLLRATGCKKCNSSLPFMRKEIGRRHLRDEEQCMDIEYGAEEYGQHMVQVYCRVVRNDVITYRCRHCDQVWDEKIQLPGSDFKLIRRMDFDDKDK